MRQPVPDYGGSLGPTGNLDINPTTTVSNRSIGLRKVSYGFGEYPYSSALALDGTYSF